MKTEVLEVLVNHPAEEVWRVWIKNFQVSLPAVTPQHYSAVEYFDGPPLAAGGEFHVYYAPTFPHFGYLKAVWEEMDHENHSLKCRIFEGGHLGDHPVHMTYSVKLLPGPHPNSTITKWTFEYDETPKGEVHEFLKEEMSIWGKSLEKYISSKSKPSPKEAARMKTEDHARMKTEDHEVLVKHSAEEVWRVWIKNFQVSLPAVAPQHYSAVDYFDGPPLAAGGVIHISYAPTFRHFGYLKAVIEEMDHENFNAKWRIFEGGHLGDHPVHLTYALKVLPGPDPNSCITKWTFEYDETPKGEIHEFIKEEMSIWGESLEKHLFSKSKASS